MRARDGVLVPALDPGSPIEAGEVVTFKLWPARGAIRDPARHFGPDRRRLLEPRPAPAHGKVEPSGPPGPSSGRPSGVMSSIPERPERYGACASAGRRCATFRRASTVKVPSGSGVGASGLPSHSRLSRLPTRVVCSAAGLA